MLTLRLPVQVQDAVLASKRKEAPHLVAPIKRYATSKLAQQYLDALASEQAAACAQFTGAATAVAAGPAGAAPQPAAPLSRAGGVLASLLPGSTTQATTQQPAQQSPLVVCDSCEWLVPTDVTSALMTQVWTGGRCLPDANMMQNCLQQWQPDPRLNAHPL